jgi:hypothetical protein
VGIAIGAKKIFAKNVKKTIISIELIISKKYVQKKNSLEN